MLRYTRYLLLALAATGVLCAQDMQPGFGFVTSIRGSVEVRNPEGKKLTLGLHESHSFDGLTLKTKKDGTLFLVLSNGVAIALAENTHIEIQTFRQIPFGPKSHSLKYEPTISDLQIHLIKGTMGLSCDHISPLSNLKIAMNSGYLRVHSTTSVLSINPLGMNISAYEGTLTFYYPDGKEREFIAHPQSVRISEQSAARGIVSESSTVDEKKVIARRLADAVSYARKRVIYRGVHGQAEPQALLLVSDDYLEQEPARPYSFKSSQLP
ncbi:MAG: hypothetical protein ACPGH0_01015 [Opitutales bacterium]